MMLRMRKMRRIAHKTEKWDKKIRLVDYDKKTVDFLIFRTFLSTYPDHLRGILPHSLHHSTYTSHTCKGLPLASSSHYILQPPTSTFHRGVMLHLS